jgi:alanyl-tRNA synthetase
MAGSLAPDEPDTLAFEAAVEVGGPEVALSETYFYPEGGGQPADRGSIGGQEVLDVQERDGDVVHVLDGELEAGQTVEAAVDPEFRRYCRRAHTASHALYGAGRRLLEDLGYGGFGISAAPREQRANGAAASTDEKVRVDFATTTDVDDATLVELERLVNRCVWESREVTWERLPKEEALARDDVAFNTKTEEGIVGNTVRIVEIDGWDVAACGGTHVRNTHEIGPVTLRSRSNPGEGLTRIEFAVGPAGIQHRVGEKGAALEAAASLGTNVETLPAEVDRLRTELEDARADRDDLEARLVDAAVAEAAADTFQRAERAWAAGVVEADADALTEAVRERPDRVDVLVLVSPSGRLAVGTDGTPEAGDVVDEITGEFGGGGGGSPTVAQAGGLDVDGEAVVEYLRATTDSDA